MTSYQQKKSLILIINHSVWPHITESVNKDSAENTHCHTYMGDYKTQF